MPQKRKLSFRISLRGLPRLKKTKGPLLEALFTEHVINSLHAMEIHASLQNMACN